MNTNTDMTVYHFWYNPATKQKEYIRTYISDVHWFKKHERILSGKEFVHNDHIDVRIPEEEIFLMDKKFILPGEYDSLDEEGAKKCWTVGKGDIIVKGDVQIDVFSLKNLKGFECCSVSSATYNFTGSAPHIHLGGDC